MRHLLILAGGQGTRLWPLSRRREPKQVHALLDGETLLQKTYRRLTEGFPANRIVVGTTAAYAPIVRAQLPALSEERMVVEPLSKGTAAAIGYAALRLLEQDPDAMFTTVNADAHVADDRAYRAAIDAAQGFAEQGRSDVVLVGVPPTYPETGYGYIEVAVGEPSGAPSARRVVRFVEKPDRETATRFVASGRHLWNPALFTFRADRLLALFARHLPAHAAALERLRDTDDADAVAAAFAAIPDTSIDYGLMERLDDLLVVPASFGWSDIGHWRAVHRALAPAADATVARAVHVELDGSGNLVVAPAGKVVATCGIRDSVIIDTPDALLVCPRDRAQEVREVVHALEERGLTHLL